MSTVNSKVLHVNTQNGTSQILLCENGGPIHAVACHPKQPLVATGNQGGILKVWDYNHKVIVCSRVLEKKEQIQCITFDPQGETVCFLNMF